ncbi:hypothetical protein CHISP_3101 [Chitinispirillum alkaliphilum]|nr:hypothetical protein CHISP_3101 [Chitinispirillum alkaliphilum]
MNRMRKLFSIVLLLGLSVTVMGQEGGENQGMQKIDTEHFFSEIMRALPDGAREKVNEASKMDNSQISDMANSLNNKEHGLEERMSEKVLDQLPLEVRERIEQTILDIENRREARMMEFRNINQN